MLRSARRLIIGVLVLALAACGGDDDTTAPASTTAAEPSSTTTAPSTTLAPATELEVVTFNAGLARGFVDLAEERVTLVADALASLDADIVALQEVWDPADVDAVIAATEADFPEHRFLEPAPESAGEPACTAAELDPLETCARSACGGLPADQLAGCVLSSCGAEFGACSGVCQTCLGANIGGTLDEVVGTCKATAERYAYGGSFGIGLLSRHPISSTEEVVLESSLNRRAILYAVVDVDALGPVHVFATHLSAVFDDIPYPGEGTWEAEQRAQIERLLALVEERVPPGEPVVVLGDLNTGPALPGLAAEAPENFALLTASGLEAPYLESARPECTFCADNPLVGGADDDESVVIDHVLVAGLAGSATDRALDDPVTIGTTESRLSDHYGVAVTLLAT